MQNDARLAIARLNLSDCLVTPASSDMFVQCLSSYARMDRAQGEQAQKDTMASLEQMYGCVEPAEGAERKPFLFSNGAAVIPVHGVLLNRFGGCWGFVTGYNFIRAQMNAALADDDVKLIVFDVNSPGGDAAGCFELTEEIRASRSVKPSIAVVDDTAASGGYAIPAAATRMVATRSSSVGSIGVYRLHMNVSGMNDQMGIEYTFIFAGDHKVDGNPYEGLSEEVRADMQASVDQRYDEFVADVLASRDAMNEDDVRGTQARVFRAQEALALGLIDGVSTPTEAVSAFVAELASDEPEDVDEEDNMALPKTEAEMAAALEAARNEGVSSVSLPDTARIAADAVAADRTRRQAILGLDEAKDKQKLAGTLADTDGMTADTAKVILASAASETVAAPAAPQKSALDSAMKNGGAKVAVEDGSAEGDGNVTENTPRDKSAGILKFVAPSRRVAEAK